MEKIIQIVQNVMGSVQYTVDGIINLCFQPIFIILQIIEGIITIWEPEEEEQEQEQYPEIPHVTGFLNHNEVDEINKIKEQLKQ